MPGYWQDVPGQGYQWISGYWMPAHLEEATYLPQPPQSLDTGPTSAAPGPNYFWIQGHWQWHGIHYVWQPGYWAAYQPDWIWVPATYAWTPRGWVYVPGYWDYPLARRGLVFSPVYFAGPVAVYRPAICLDAGAFSISLFCPPDLWPLLLRRLLRRSLRGVGHSALVYYNSPRYGYDPLFTYYRWYHVEHMGETAMGPAIWSAGTSTIAPIRTCVRRTPWRPSALLLASRAGRARPDLQQLRMARDIHEAAVRSLRLQAVSAAEHAQLHEAAKQTVRFTAERQQLERNPAAPPRAAARR